MTSSSALPVDSGGHVLRLVLRGNGFASCWQALVSTEDKTAAREEPTQQVLRDFLLERLREIGECQVAAKDEVKRAVR
jgi:hypothetical protein